MRKINWYQNITEPNKSQKICIILGVLCKSPKPWKATWIHVLYEQTVRKLYIFTDTTKQ